MLTVSIHKGSEKLETLQFDKPIIMIGRSSGNDIVLDGTGVSRYHARISFDKKRTSVTDLNSTNGTFLNGEKIHQQTLTGADTVDVGDFSLHISFDLREEQNAGDWIAVGRKTVVAQEPAASLELIKQVSAEPPQKAPDPKGTESQKRKEDSRKKTESVIALSAPIALPAEPIVPSPEGDVVVATDGDFYWNSLKNFLVPIWSYLSDPAVTEILVNGPDKIFIEKKGQLAQVSEQFKEPELRAAVLNIAQYVGRRVSEEDPYLDARLPDGSRVAILFPPCSRNGISLAIRKFSNESLTLDKLLEFGSLSREMIAYLRACVELKKNIIIAGGTSSGKTSLLNVVSGLIPGEERIISIEDSAELQLKQNHVLSMETKPPDKKGRGQVTIRDLVRASLRMRPDRIVVGEIRGGEALDLLQALNTGHSGSMATIHASSPRQALSRLETLALFSGIELPMTALREQVASAIDIVIQASRLPDHSRRVTHISEIGKVAENNSYEVFDIFRYKRDRGPNQEIRAQHIITGTPSMFAEELELAGFTEVLELLAKPDIS